MLSIIVPTFNKQDFVGRTIKSVLDQTFADFELIVVDDGSTDETVNRILEIDDPRLLLVCQENKGEGGARNTGMTRARRPWIALLDADDYWFPDHLSELARIIDAFPDVGMIATSFIAGEAWQAPPPNDRSDVIEKIDYFSTAAKEIGVVWSSTAAIRRDVVERVGGFGSFRRGADQEYWARTALVTPVARSRRVTAYYYRHPDSVMAQDHYRKEIAPRGIEEMWPSVAVIRSVQNNPAFHDKRPGMIAYERHATYLSMIGYISRHEFDVARRLASQMPGTDTDKATMIAALLKLPDVAIRGMLRLRSTLRNAGRALSQIRR